MPNRDIASTITTNLANSFDDVIIGPTDTESPTGQKETYIYNHDWTKWFAYYISIPEVKIAIDTRVLWTAGKGWKADIRTTVVLDRMKGSGEDTFNSFLKNMVAQRRINGRAYAEIIRDKDGLLLNLKPLNPSTIREVYNAKGMIDRYEQTSKLPQFPMVKAIHKLRKNQVFRLVNKRVADDAGRSDIEAIEKIILANNESFDDFKKVVHRNVHPVRIVEVDLDDDDEILAASVKYESMIINKEVLFVPKDTVEIKDAGMSSQATFNPLPWRNHLRDYFFQVVGIPQIIMGSSGEFNEATAKIAYLAFQQSVEDEQLEIEQQFYRQVFYKIELNFPATMQNELISDTEKDGKEPAQGFQPQDTEAPTAPPVAGNLPGRM